MGTSRTAYFATNRLRSRAAAIDHFVGGSKDRRRHVEAERRARLQVDGQHELGGDLHGNVTSVGALQDFVDKGCPPPIHVDEHWAVTYQPASSHIFR